MIIGINELDKEWSNKLIIELIGNNCSFIANLTTWYIIELFESYEEVIAETIELCYSSDDEGLIKLAIILLFS